MAAWPWPVAIPNRTTISWTKYEIGSKRIRSHKQVRAVLGAGLNVSGNRAGIVVGLHDNQAGAENHQERERMGCPGVGDPD